MSLERNCCGFGKEEVLLAVTAAAEVAGWTHYLLLLAGGGKTPVALLVIQGLALGLRSAATWLLVR